MIITNGFHNVLCTAETTKPELNFSERLTIKKRFVGKFLYPTYSLLTCQNHREIIAIDKGKEMLCKKCSNFMTYCGSATVYNKKIHVRSVDLLSESFIPMIRVYNFLEQYTDLQKKESKGSGMKYYFSNIRIGRFVEAEFFTYILATKEQIRQWLRTICPIHVKPNNMFVYNGTTTKRIRNFASIMEELHNSNDKISTFQGKISSKNPVLYQINNTDIQIYQPRDESDLLELLKERLLPSDIINVLIEKKEVELYKVELKMHEKYNHFRKFRVNRGMFVLHSGIPKIRQIEWNAELPNTNIFSYAHECLKILLGDLYNSVDQFFNNVVDEPQFFAASNINPYSFYDKRGYPDTRKKNANKHRKRRYTAAKTPSLPYIVMVMLIANDI